MLKEILTFSNCYQYLESMSFTDIQLTGVIAGNIYLTAYCLDDEIRKEIEFESNENNIIVSTRISVNDPFVILEVLND